MSNEFWSTLIPFSLRINHSSIYVLLFPKDERETKSDNFMLEKLGHTKDNNEKKERVFFKIDKTLTLSSRFLGEFGINVSQFTASYCYTRHINVWDFLSSLLCVSFRHS